MPSGRPAGDADGREATHAEDVWEEELREAFGEENRTHHRALKADRGRRVSGGSVLRHVCSSLCSPFFVQSRDAHPDPSCQSLSVVEVPGDIDHHNASFSFQQQKRSDQLGPLVVEEVLVPMPLNQFR